MVKKNIKESSRRESTRLEKMKSRIKSIEQETKLKKQLKEAEEKLENLRKTKKKKNPTTKLKETFKQISDLQEQAERKPISDSEKMWVMSVWENRKTLDPNYDPDNWFKSSVYMDNKQRSKDIDDFWTGKNKGNTDDFWTGSMWGI